MKEITYIGPLHTGLIFGLITAIVSLVMTFFYSVVPAILSASSYSIGSTVYMWLYFPVILGVSSFFSAMLACIVYNFIAKKFGGIKLMFS